VSESSLLHHEGHEILQLITPQNQNGNMLTKLHSITVTCIAEAKNFPSVCWAFSCYSVTVQLTVAMFP